jgi:hypothetical protein
MRQFPGSISCDGAVGHLRRFTLAKWGLDFGKGGIWQGTIAEVVGDGTPLIENA